MRYGRGRRAWGWRLRYFLIQSSDRGDLVGTIKVKCLAEVEFQKSAFHLQLELFCKEILTILERPEL